jgi:Flp pilus assembly protein CpaB
MTRKKQILIAGLAAAAVLSVSYLAVRPTEASEGILVPVLALDLPAGSLLTAEGVVLMRMPVGSFPDGSLLSIEEVVGLRATVPLFEGESLLRERFSDVATGTLHPGAAAGRRIYALALKAEDAAGWWLTEGNRVDLHLFSEASDDALVHEVLQEVRVAGVMDGKGNLVGIGREAGVPAILCLDVDAAQAARLAEAETQGRIKAILVNETME